MKNVMEELTEVSSIQKSMWLTQKLYPESALFNVAGYCEFDGIVNEQKIKQCLTEIMNEQEMLKTIFVEQNNTIYQMNCKQPTGIIEVIKEPNLDLQQYLDDEMKKRISYNQPYCFSIIYCNEKTIVFIKLHHMICDGFSITLFIDQFKKKMDGLNDDDGKKLSYFDYVNNEKEYINTARYKKDEEFWLSQVGQEKGVGFQSCKASGVSESNYIERKSIFINRAAFNNISEEVSKNSTVFHYIISIIYLLNYLYDNDDFYLGLPIYNRRANEKTVIGPYLKMIPFGIDMSSCKKFSDILKAANSKLFECYRHLHYPINDLPQENRKAGLSYNVSFSYQRINYPDSIDGTPTKFTYMNPSEQQEDLVFRLIENLECPEDDVEFCIDYKKDSFKSDVIQLMLERFSELFQTTYKNIDVDISTIDAVNSEYLNKKLAEYSKTTCEFPDNVCIHSFFEKQVELCPEKTAVKFEDKEVSYKELEKQTKLLAKFLQANGVKTNTLVGLCMERSIEMVQAIVGVYRSGGAYVPIDPEYPKERIEYMISDSNAEIIIAQKKFEALLPAGAKVFFIDEDWEKLSEYENRELDRTVQAENWAYMIYTSGSTGKPKGAINFHKSLVNRIIWMQKEMKMTSADVVLQKTPFSFDVSVWEFVWPLMVGATIIMARPGGHRNPQYLADVIEKEKVTTLHFVPSMLRIFADNVSSEKCTSLKRIICSGEELKADLMRDCLNKFDCDLYNLYGPTEAAIDVSYWKCYARENLKTVPIGKSIDNIQLYVLNKNKKLLPDGVSGELYISGVGLAYGYYNKEELSKEKFIANTVNPDFCPRMYRTADLAKYNEYDEIEYLGRADFQVKINGLRIELGEIEFQLEKLDFIHQAKVIDVADNKGIKCLVAYIEKEPGTVEMDVREIKIKLKEELPAYMVPVKYVYLDKLPLSPNGKLDRKALPAVSLVAEDRKIAKPKNDEEKELLKLFKEILEIDELGVEDDFFEFGGTSLKGIQLVTKYKKIELDELFKYSTVRDIVEYISENKKQNYGCLNLLKYSKQAKLNLVCIPYGGGVSTIYNSLANQMSDDYNVYAVNLCGHSYVNQDDLVDIDKMSMIIATDINKYITGDVVLYGHCVGSALAFEVDKKLDYIGVNVVNLFVGGTSPYYANYFKRIFARRMASYYYSNDERTEKFIKKIGGVVGNLDREQKKRVYSWFRHDGRNALNYFEHLRKEKYMVKNLMVILGEDDPLTSDIHDVHNWEHHAKSIKYAKIASAGHYFIESNSKEVADLLMKNII